MKKNERREALLSVGLILLLLGGISIYDLITRPLAWDTVGTKILELFGGGFLVIIGVYCCAWGVSDEAGKNASKFLKDVWNTFLDFLKG